MYKKYVLVLSFLSIVTACGGGSSSGGGEGSGFLPANPEAAITIGGSWLIQETDDGNDCGEGDLSDSWNATIVQTSSKVVLTDEDGGKHNGVVDGNTLYWVATFDEDGGTTTSKGKVTWDGTDMTGSASWTWKGDGESCSGKTTILATCHAEVCDVTEI